MEFLLIIGVWFGATLLIALAINSLFNLLFKSDTIYKFIEKIL